MRLAGLLCADVWLPVWAEQTWVCVFLAAAPWQSKRCGHSSRCLAVRRHRSSEWLCLRSSASVAPPPAKGPPARQAVSLRLLNDQHLRPLRDSGTAQPTGVRGRAPPTSHHVQTQRALPSLCHRAESSDPLALVSAALRERERARYSCKNHGHRRRGERGHVYTPPARLPIHRSQAATWIIRSCTRVYTL